MAKNVQLKDPVTGVPVYPITLTDNVYLSEGSSLTEALNGKLDVSAYQNYRQAVKIFEGNISSTSTNTLTRAITDFSLICIRTKWAAGYSDFMTIPSSELLNIGSASVRLVSSTDALYASYYFPTSRTFIRQDAASNTFVRIFGIL